MSTSPVHERSPNMQTRCQLPFVKTTIDGSVVQHQAVFASWSGTVAAAHLCRAIPSLATNTHRLQLIARKALEQAGTHH